ncbi:hypothetical protein C8J57DRAFT_1100445, partial [Mycena rebaudengoi]
YNPGFLEPSLEYAKAGGALYNQYTQDPKNLMSHLNAVAFIAMGGMASWIAQLYDDTILGHFLSGPSAQVSEFG